MGQTKQKVKYFHRKEIGISLLCSAKSLSTFQSPEFSVTRQHEDFVWLHDTLTETTDYAGLIVSSF